LDEDQEKWNKKFSIAVKERLAFKKKFQEKRNFSIHTHNTNIEMGNNDKIKPNTYTGGLLLPESSEY
jgi:hypothetical protein